MSGERVQVGTVEITRHRVYPIDPLAREQALRTDVLVEPGTYPVFCQRGMTYYWQMTGTIDGMHEQLGDGAFGIRGGDVATPDEVVFYSRRFGADEWADILTKAAQPGSALIFHMESGQL